MPARPYRVKDDSVTEPAPGAPERVGKPGRERGEAAEQVDGPEPGRRDAPPKGPTERPRGKSTARDTTSVDPQDPIDPSSPNLR
ncbi:MAG: hypothetical protein M3125_09570 [Gemmatimonadota bacterium]|nr:hypothetical protein [Gemmatimonadota bacterium]